MRAVIALIFLAIAWHPIAGITAYAGTYFGTHLTATLTLAAAVLLARHAPRHSHPIIAFLLGAGIATWITGHHAEATNLFKRSPAGPQIPTN